jgi:hypothetical protein
MKLVGKNLFPEIHFNPIYRDLLVVAGAGLLVAMALVTAAFMVLH